MKKEETRLYNIIINNIQDKYDYNELIKIFLRPEDYRLFAGQEYEGPSSEEDTLIEFNSEGFKDKNQIKREIYQGLSQITKTSPPWGILTGVRPVKLMRELSEKYASSDRAAEKLRRFYLLSEEKVRLLTEIYKYQQSALGKAAHRSQSVYIGIPFCPSRCLYCSFTSNQKGPEEIEKYMEALMREIEYAGDALRKSGSLTESIYIGGGTPTTLRAEQLDALLSKTEEAFDLSALREFTVEAGRPDTITKEKLRVIADHGIKRISINPQTMKDSTLKLIGRSHSVEDIRQAFRTAKETGDFLINADVIAGLPEETPEDFENTLSEIISLDPANITVHTLAVKRASRLIESDASYHYRQAKTVERMLKSSGDILKAAGYRPYYLYRQKHMAGAMENTGYCKGDTPCIYNIRIMDENQSILALGAGGISKRYYPEENRLERIPNVSNYSVYIERLDEMTQRKEKNFFKEV